ncbi:tumor suppressor candidate 3-like [Centruroides sculpturatus]|uniref:tumor suppressor candidate 3-like n=1 Tax=Centruroides sculpturatus TaxID=218467 RepID=UPI000C6D5EC0|nr:tumor suppressor candidate 3-like [Centruroides sculpturatus]
MTAKKTRCFVVLFVFLCILQYGNGNPKRKEVQTLGERVQQLMDMSAKRPIIRLNGEKFRQYVKASPRNYSFVVMLTALSPHRQCIVCRHAHDEFQIVANSWRYSQMYSNKLFFGMVDFDEGPDVFTSVSIFTIIFIYNFVHISHTDIYSAKNLVSNKVSRIGFAAETISRWLGERTDIQIRVFRPPNYSGTIALVILFALIGALLYMRRNNLDFLYNKTSWGLAALCVIFAMTSGQMWNHIRGPPFMHRTNRGNVAYIHGSSGGQFIIETYIVIILNAAVVFGVILLNEAAASKGESKKRKIMAIIGLAVVAIFFSLLLSIFRSKAHGYPYSFLFK